MEQEPHAPSEAQPGPGPAPSGEAPQERDADLVTLEGLESELADLDAELARVERADGPSGSGGDAPASGVGKPAAG